MLISPIRSLRKKLGISQSDLALLVGSHPSKICLVERGVVQLSPKLLDVIEDLGESADEIQKLQAEFIEQQRKTKLAELVKIGK